jgi:hypothetical protein
LGLSLPPRASRCPDLPLDFPLLGGTGGRSRTTLGLARSAGASKSASQSSSASELTSLYDILRRRRRLRSRGRAVGSSGAGEAAGEGSRLEGSSCVGWCLAERRDGAVCFLLALWPSSELSEISSSVLGSLYETLSRLRFTVTAMVSQSRPECAGVIGADEGCQALKSQSQKVIWQVSTLGINARVRERGDRAARSRQLRTSGRGSDIID